MSGEHMQRQDLEDLAAIVENALSHGEPCYCGTGEDVACPACGAEIAGQQAFTEIMRRFRVALNEEAST